MLVQVVVINFFGDQQLKMNSARRLVKRLITQIRFHDYQASYDLFLIIYGIRGK